jgi:hypothetical protein
MHHFIIPFAGLKTKLYAYETLIFAFSLIFDGFCCGSATCKTGEI